MNLAELEIGKSAIIKKIECNKNLKEQFLKMGLTPNEKIKLVKVAPLGDPIEVSIRGYELTLRKKEAEKIIIDKKYEKNKNFNLKYKLIDNKKKLKNLDNYKKTKNRKMKFALVGNQNSGKTTLFNQLTGSNQHVGNFPGVTVEKKEGIIKKDNNIKVIDLPGLYSLEPYTSEEGLSKNFILKNNVDGIINIVDATNIERNLYLTMELIELNIPMIIALNMIDELYKNGGKIIINNLENLLGVPVIAISAKKNQGIDKLILNAKKIAEYKIIPQNENINKECINQSFKQNNIIEKSIKKYLIIDQICKQAVIKPKENKNQKISIKIDKVLTGKYTAIPIFIAIIGIIFWLTFDIVGGRLSEYLAIGIDELKQIINNLLIIHKVNPIIHSLIIEGIITGVGSVLSFLPIIVVLFFFLSILEDTGYMARVSFIMDKLLDKIGLSGKSLVPMLLGFGCSVPAIMATRTLPSKKDKIITILLIPFMSCSAKLPIYALFTAVFFKKNQTLIMIIIYLIGIIIGILVAIFLKNKKIFKEKSKPFILELPNYKMPNTKNIIRLIIRKTNEFIEKSFTTIFYTSLIIWFLQKFDIKLQLAKNASNSLLALIGNLITPIFKPLGFLDWRISTSLIAGFTAKENVVSTMTILLGNISKINNLFTPKTAFVFLIFTLLYTPCIAAIATIKKELGRKWAIFILFFQCIIAWIVSFIIKTILIIKI